MVFSHLYTSRGLNELSWPGRKMYGNWINMNDISINIANMFLKTNFLNTFPTHIINKIHLLTHCAYWRHMATCVRDNIGTGNGLPDGIKLMLSYQTACSCACHLKAIVVEILTKVIITKHLRITRWELKLLSPREQWVNTFKNAKMHVINDACCSAVLQQILK